MAVLKIRINGVWVRIPGGGGVGSSADSRYLLRTLGDFATFSTKATPVAGDVILIEDSEDGGAKKSATLASLLGGGSTREGRFLSVNSPTEFAL